jgi:hypothetical protein
MIITRVNFNGQKVRIARGAGFAQYQMLALGQMAVDTIKARVANTVGSSDAPMKALAPNYAKWKQRIGLQPVRDLRGPGQITYLARTYKEGTGRVPAGARLPGQWRNAVHGANNRLAMVPGLRPGRDYLVYQANIRFRSVGGGAHMLDNFAVRSADENSVRMDISAQWARDRARANEQRAPWYGFSPNDIRAIALMAQQLFRANVTSLAAQLRGQSNAVWMDPLGIQGQMLKRFAA